MSILHLDPFHRGMFTMIREEGNPKNCSRDINMLSNL